MAPETLTYTVVDRVARITLNRPERGNGITRLLACELEQHVEHADLDPAVHVILLSGNGKGFCGGYDLVESAEGQGSDTTGSSHHSGEQDSTPNLTASRATKAPPSGSPLDPAVMPANHNPAGPWD